MAHCHLLEDLNEAGEGEALKRFEPSEGKVAEDLLTRSTAEEPPGRERPDESHRGGKLVVNKALRFGVQAPIFIAVGVQEASF